MISITSSLPLAQWGINLMVPFPKTTGSKIPNRRNWLFHNMGQFWTASVTPVFSLQNKRLITKSKVLVHYFSANVFLTKDVVDEIMKVCI